MKNTMMMLVAALILSVGAPILMAHADDDEHEGRGRPSMVASDPVYKKECGDCHMAYPPALLPGNTWRAIMEDLPNHFGEDASLDAATRTHIEAYLAQNSSRGGAASPLRISEQRWFRAEHRGDISRWTSRTNAKSWSNCKACHRGAEQGMFDDD